jgi:hypothetical protein
MDLQEVVHDAFFNHNIVVKDFSTGDYLNYDGTFNTGFTATPLVSSNLEVVQASARIINVWADWSELNRYRAVVKVVYENRVD